MGSRHGSHAPPPGGGGLEKGLERPPRPASLFPPTPEFMDSTGQRIAATPPTTGIRCIIYLSRPIPRNYLEYS